MNSKYFARNIDKDLSSWRQAAKHKPLILRGARQVGKSSTVRELAKQFDYFLEINFEEKESKDARLLFEKSSSPKRICDELSLIYDTPIIPERTLLCQNNIVVANPTSSVVPINFI